MAPMTGTVANGQKDGLILLASFHEGFFGPWVPIHRIIGVLDQIGAKTLIQSIRHKGNRLRGGLWGLFHSLMHDSRGP